MGKKKTVLIVASHFAPNVGGVETHLDDLSKALTKRGWKVVVSTYVPLAREVKVPYYEEKKNLKIYRMPWVGFNIVHKLTPYPALEFLYLFPGLFLITLIALLANPKISVLHAQGLVPSVVALILGRLSGRRVVMSTHNLYFFPRSGFYRSFSRIVLSWMDKILCLSKQSQGEILNIGVPKDKVGIFRYWLDLKLFAPVDKKKAREELGLPDGFITFFVGRLIETKGVNVLLKTAAEKSARNIFFVFAGLGPLAERIQKYARIYRNVLYVGPLTSDKVKLYMAASDIVSVPSLVDEGYGRVAMEALACGRPVLAAKKGGLSEVVSPKVGVLVKPMFKEYLRYLQYHSKHEPSLGKLAKNTRVYAKKMFNERNVDVIISAYQR